tara:strand:- start:685 stop:918 length:234 start_codon:yes stop_codon:yes gene_type:complete
MFGCLAIKPTEYFIGMDIEEFKSINDGLILVENKAENIVFSGKECKECKEQYYIFINGQLEASLSFWGGFENFKLAK